MFIARSVREASRQPSDAALLGNGKAVTFPQFCERTTLTAHWRSDLLQLNGWHPLRRLRNARCELGPAHLFPAGLVAVALVRTERGDQIGFSPPKTLTSIKSLGKFT